MCSKKVPRGERSRFASSQSDSETLECWGIKSSFSDVEVSFS